MLYFCRMTITTHAAVGTIIGLNVGNPVLGFVIGFISHFLLDMIPHGDSKISDNLRIHKKKKGPITYGTIDAIIAIFFLFTVLDNSVAAHSRVFYWSVAGSIMPDLISGVYDLTKSKWLKRYNEIHFYFHDFFVNRWHDVPLTYSLLGQLIFVLIVLTLI